MSNKTSLYTPYKIDFTQEKMFFGSGKNTQRFDVMKYEWFDKNNNVQQGNDWPWDEITIKNDIVDHSQHLTEAQQHIIKRSLQRAAFLDSINGRGPVLIFGQVTNLPELEALTTTWQHFEVNKHSRTYTKHLRAFYSNPDEVFDESFKIEELQKTAAAIAGPYDAAYKGVIKWIYHEQNELPLTEEEIKEIRTNFIMAWIEVNILEGIRFYPFFSSIWGMHNGTKVMNELSGDLIFICRDENEHLNLTQHVLKLLRKQKDEGFTELFRELTPRIKERYYEAYQEECSWIHNELFKYGSYRGMSANIMEDYVNYLTIRRMAAIGLKADANAMNGKLVTKHPIPWVEDYIHNDEEEKLPQQENVLNYITNGIRDDIFPENISSSIKKYVKVRG